MYLFFFYAVLMSPTVQDIFNIIDSIAPVHLAEPWDNVGLMVGNWSAQVTAILLGLDPTTPLLDEALTLNANLVITHHPVIFHPLKSIHLDQPDGQFIELALKNKMSIISSHTNFDSAPGGTSDILAQLLGLQNIQPLVPHECGEPGCGIGRVGDYVDPLSPEDFIERLRTACAPPWLLGAGTVPRRISRVAVCGGSCSELAEQALRAEAQVLLTAEVKHHIARRAEETGLWLIDAGHFATELPGMHNLARLLAAEADKRFGGIPVAVCGIQGSPLHLI
ncbi:MAG TPA: Nif3-like dinuclear metal center hexameric protein [Desulfobulbaceae bacterium]|nr:Nif3-like dinuclear metal center hexameric protein [Desulfobulbaceae bacterium]